MWFIIAVTKTGEKIAVSCQREKTEFTKYGAQRVPEPEDFEKDPVRAWALALSMSRDLKVWRIMHFESVDKVPLWVRQHFVLRTPDWVNLGMGAG